MARGEVDGQQKQDGHHHGQQIEPDDAQPEGVARVVQPPVTGDDHGDEYIDRDPLRQQHHNQHRLHLTERHWRQEKTVLGDVRRLVRHSSQQLVTSH